MSIPIWNLFFMITLQLKFQSDLWSNILGRICSLDSFRCRLGLAGQASMCFDTCILFEMRTQNLKSQLVSWMPCSLQFHVCVDYKLEFYCPSYVNERFRGVPRSEAQPLRQEYKAIARFIWICEISVFRFWHISPFFLLGSASWT